jgi:hypothetical protein
MKIKRLSDGKIFVVRKYILDTNNNEESIWCDGWYGRHLLNIDCVFIGNLDTFESWLKYEKKEFGEPSFENIIKSISEHKKLENGII